VSVKNEVKSNKINQEIRSELSLALNNWQDLDSASKSSPKKDHKSSTDIDKPLPQKKTKLLKVIQQQLKSLSF
jgi:hypothetical protein